MSTISIKKLKNNNDFFYPQTHENAVLGLSEKLSEKADSSVTDKLSEEINNLDASIEDINENINLINSSISLIDGSISLIDGSISLIDGSISANTTKISNNAANIAYYECSTAAATAKKTILTAGGTYSRMIGGSLKVKFTYANTASSGVKFQVDDVAEANLYYNGDAVTDTNTWKAGDIVEIFFDGTKYQAFNVNGDTSEIEARIDELEEAALKKSLTIYFGEDQERFDFPNAMGNISITDAQGNNCTTVDLVYGDRDWANPVGDPTGPDRRTIGNFGNAISLSNGDVLEIKANKTASGPASVTFLFNLVQNNS